MKNKNVYFFLGIIVLALISYVASKGIKTNSSLQIPQNGSQLIHVVAAENFYGDIVKQLGGNHVQVLSILSDPNVDPHEYESNVQDGIAISKADIVIKNGAGYDTWMDKLISASPNKNRVVLTGSDIADHKLEDNPHVWYGIGNIKTIAQKITDTLKQKDMVDAGEFDTNLTAFDTSLQQISQKIADMKAKYNNTPVGLTETIYLYQTQPEGLNVLTPLKFEQAIAEGNDPSADDVAKANDQITNNQIKVLIYNKQTVTPITTNMQNEAKSHNIPVVPVTETMPITKHYQNWMMDQLTTLDNALQSATK